MAKLGLFDGSRHVGSVTLPPGQDMPDAVTRGADVFVYFQSDRLNAGDAPMELQEGEGARFVKVLGFTPFRSDDFVELPKDRLFSPEEAAARELWARRFVTEITGVARGLGYGMFHGGSLIRDIDLIAVPWRGRQWRGESKELSHLDFVLELCHCLPLQMGNHGETLFGHRWYALWHTAHRDHQIDLKVILPVSGGAETSIRQS